MQSSKRTRRYATTALAAGMSMVVAVGVRAEAPGVGIDAGEAVVVGPDALQREALAIARDGRLVEAARMLEEGAAERPESPETAELLVLAARLYGHAERTTEAYRTLRRAAEVAFRAGESERSAHLLIDAATLAMEDGRDADANAAAELAGYVLRVSELTLEQRMAVLRRVEYPAG